MSSEKLSDNEKNEAIGSITGSENVSLIYEKLNRKFVNVNVPRRLNEVKSLEALLRELEDVDVENKDDQIKEVERRIAASKNDYIDGVLVPLTNMELLTVQGIVTEAHKHGVEAKLDLDIRLFMLAKAEQCATVYYSLRRVDDRSKFYFVNQEEVVLADEETLRHIAQLYKDSYVLTDDERKKLYGAPRS